MEAERSKQKKTRPLIDLTWLDELLSPYRPSSNDDTNFGPAQPHAHGKDELVVQYFLFSFQPAYRRKSVSPF